MNASCPNLSNKQVKKEFDELVDVFGEDTAYFLWDKNEGYSLDKAPNGADSKLFLSLMDKYQGDRVKALVGAAKQLTSNPTEEQQDEIYENNKYLSEQIINYFKRNSKGQLLAPNGEVSHLTERQYAQVRTKEFKNWFGDWENNPSKASKVVNEDGTPKVVYHGTDKGGFYVFDPKMSDDKISLFFSDSKVTSITFYHFLSR